MPRCESCGSRAGCEAAAVLRPEYPRCRTPLRDVDFGRTSALLQWLAAEAGVGADTSAAIHQPLLARYATDRHERPDVLELSFSCDAAGAHLYRFSYGFPTLRRERASVERVLLDLCQPLGAPVVEAARTVLRAARSPGVEQIIFGYAHAEGDSPPRIKLYVHFLAGEPALALDVAARMLGRRCNEFAHPGPLHLLGLDVGSSGLSGAKLYFLLDRVRVDEVAGRIGPVPVVSALAALGLSELREVLAVHRMRAPDDAGVELAAEVDFALEPNELRWVDVRALAPVRALLERNPRVAALERSFRLAVRRVSGSVGDGGKLNVYYGLSEREGEASPGA
jgi:hypothetical protein